MYEMCLYTEHCISYTVDIVNKPSASFSDLIWRRHRQHGLPTFLLIVVAIGATVVVPESTND